MSNYRPLPTTFHSDGFDFELLRREGDVALFKKLKPGHSRAFYEVVLIRKRPAKTWPDGRITEARETMPPSEAWGKEGFSPATPEAAEESFRNLLRAQLRTA